MTENNIIIGIDTGCYKTSIAAISLKGNIIFNERLMLGAGKNKTGMKDNHKSCTDRVLIR